jgi:hypothetical protein
LTGRCPAAPHAGVRHARPDGGIVSFSMHVEHRSVQGQEMNEAGLTPNTVIGEDDKPPLD